MLRTILIACCTLLKIAAQSYANNRSTLHVAIAPGGGTCAPAATLVTSVRLSLRTDVLARVHVFQTVQRCNDLLIALEERLEDTEIMFYSIPNNISMKGRVCSRRRELCTMENFAAFLAPDIIDVGRILYLDVDTVVVDDISKLLEFKLGKAPVAGVEDCAQKMTRYFADEDKAMARYPSLPSSFFKKCVINRGVLLINVKQWRKLSMTEKILRLFSENLENPLWQSGVSQPPFLLALAFHPFKRLTHEYNVRGLGRVDASRSEIALMLGQGVKNCRIDVDLFEVMVWGHTKELSVVEPFAHPYTHCGKILHYTGAKKPWKGLAGSICSCGYQCLQPCREFYLSYERYYTSLLSTAT